MSDGIPPRRQCATIAAHHALMESDPDYRRNRRQIELHNGAFSRMTDRLGRRTGVAFIPVVVHVVYHTDEQNIAEAQIRSQLKVLNQDFRKVNADVSKVPPIWRDLVADARVEFRLAVRDPNGNPTEGITRTKTDQEVFSFDERLAGTPQGDPVKFVEGGGVPPWPRDQYLNIWVCALDGGLLGYAQFPGGPAATDGVVIDYQFFGTSGTATQPFHLGRTTTHEVGHWLDLYHIWGDDGDGCDGTDRVDDTPNQAGPNNGMPTFPHVSCDNAPGGDMFVNYMDYTDDEGMFMFTIGQSVRMDATLLGPRVSLLSSEGLMPVRRRGGAEAAADVDAESQPRRPRPPRLRLAPPD